MTGSARETQTEGDGGAVKCSPPSPFWETVKTAIASKRPGVKGYWLGNEVRFYLKSPSGIDIWIGSPEGSQEVQQAVPAHETQRSLAILEMGVPRSPAIHHPNVEVALQ